MNAETSPAADDIGHSAALADTNMFERIRSWFRSDPEDLSQDLITSKNLARHFVDAVSQKYPLSTFVNEDSVETVRNGVAPTGVDVSEDIGKGSLPKNRWQVGSMPVQKPCHDHAVPGRAINRNCSRSNLGYTELQHQTFMNGIPRIPTATDNNKSTISLQSPGMERIVGDFRNNLKQRLKPCSNLGSDAVVMQPAVCAKRLKLSYDSQKNRWTPPCRAVRSVRQKSAAGKCRTDDKVARLRMPDADECQIHSVNGLNGYPASGRISENRGSPSLQLVCDDSDDVIILSPSKVTREERLGPLQRSVMHEAGCFTFTFPQCRHQPVPCHERERSVRSRNSSAKKSGAVIDLTLEDSGDETVDISSSDDSSETQNQRCLHQRGRVKDLPADVSAKLKKLCRLGADVRQSCGVGSRSNQTNNASCESASNCRMLECVSAGYCTDPKCAVCVGPIHALSENRSKKRTTDLSSNKVTSMSSKALATVAMDMSLKLKKLCKLDLKRSSERVLRSGRTLAELSNELSSVIETFDRDGVEIVDDSETSIRSIVMSASCDTNPANLSESLCKDELIDISSCSVATVAMGNQQSRLGCHDNEGKDGLQVEGGVGERRLLRGHTSSKDSGIDVNSPEHLTTEDCALFSGVATVCSDGMQTCSNEADSCVKEAVSCCATVTYCSSEPTVCDSSRKPVTCSVESVHAEESSAEVDNLRSTVNGLFRAEESKCETRSISKALLISCNGLIDDRKQTVGYADRDKADDHCVVCDVDCGHGADVIADQAPVLDTKCDQLNMRRQRADDLHVAYDVYVDVNVQFPEYVVSEKCADVNKECTAEVGAERACVNKECIAEVGAERACVNMECTVEVGAECACVNKECTAEVGAECACVNKEWTAEVGAERACVNKECTAEVGAECACVNKECTAEVGAERACDNVECTADVGAARHCSDEKHGTEMDNVCVWLNVERDGDELGVVAEVHPENQSTASSAAQIPDDALESSIFDTNYRCAPTNQVPACEVALTNRVNAAQITVKLLNMPSTDDMNESFVSSNLSTNLTPHSCTASSTSASSTNIAQVELSSQSNNSDNSFLVNSTDCVSLIAAAAENFASCEAAALLVAAVGVDTAAAAVNDISCKAAVVKAAEADVSVTVAAENDVDCDVAAGDGTAAGVDAAVAVNEVTTDQAAVSACNADSATKACEVESENPFRALLSTCSETRQTVSERMLNLLHRRPKVSESSLLSSTRSPVSADNVDTVPCYPQEVHEVPTDSLKPLDVPGNTNVVSAGETSHNSVVSACLNPTASIPRPTASSPDRPVHDLGQSVSQLSPTVSQACLELAVKFQRPPLFSVPNVTSMCDAVLPSVHKASESLPELPTNGNTSLLNNQWTVEAPVVSAVSSAESDQICTDLLDVQEAVNCLDVKCPNESASGLTRSTMCSSRQSRQSGDDLYVRHVASDLRASRNELKFFDEFARFVDGSHKSKRKNASSDVRVNGAIIDQDCSSSLAAYSPTQFGQTKCSNRKRKKLKLQSGAETDELRNGCCVASEWIGGCDGAETCVENGTADGSLSAAGSRLSVNPSVYDARSEQGVVLNTDLPEISPPQSETAYDYDDYIYLGDPVSGSTVLENPVTGNTVLDDPVRSSTVLDDPVSGSTGQCNFAVGEYSYSHRINGDICSAGRDGSLRAKELSTTPTATSSVRKTGRRRCPNQRYFDSSFIVGDDADFLNAEMRHSNEPSTVLDRRKSSLANSTDMKCPEMMVSHPRADEFQLGHETLARLRGKLCELFDRLFPCSLYPPRFHPHSPSVDAVLDSVLRVLSNGQLVSESSLLFDPKVMLDDPKVMLCRDLDSCLRRLQRKTLRLVRLLTQGTVDLLSVELQDVEALLTLMISVNDKV